ncbi:hypothetical protein DPMN_015374 [Dreissena polymorpha]|uniref:Uncharacterized protein n=1 Tax=Dreissena polymorpha TaxID=45954 RepID=A0A9D4NBG0_DREPO|nr:hypothetical protein DPMN_015374 [Dreissena polymorpha]
MWMDGRTMDKDLNQDTNILTKFLEDWTKNVTSRVFTCFHYIQIEKTAPPPGGHVFLPICTIFELVQDINKTNVLTKNFTSRVFTICELDRGIIGTNPLIKFHEDRTRNVASRVFTNQMWTDGRRTKTDPKGS